MSRPDLIGTVLAGRYKIMGLIGEGGMGSVYLGEQIAMGRKTAIKVLHASADDDAAIARFRRGSRNAARIDHPNVCRIFEYGDPPGGLHFLAMEFIDGESIHDLLKWKDPIPLGRATRIIAQTVEALHAAHSLGIVHRDLKPANIMLTRDARGDEIVKVVDFDIARAPYDTGDEEITQLDWMVGTPLFMSPEQFNAQPPDPRSDIYSLGIVLFRIISGSFPFSATASPWAIMAERMSSPPRPLSEAAPEMVFPPELQEVLDRALQPDPDKRWPSVQAFGEALLAAVGSRVEEKEPLEEESPATELREGSWNVVSRLKKRTLAASDSELERQDPAEAAATADVVDPQIPTTKVGPKPPLSPTKEHSPRTRGSSARRLRRTMMAMTVTLALGAGVWGVYTALAGPPPPRVPGGENPETTGQRLAGIGGGNGNVPVPVSVPEPPDVFPNAEQNGGDTPDAPGSSAGGLATPPDVSFAETAEQRLSGFERQFELFAGGDVPVAVAEAADSVARRIYDQSAGIPELRARAASVLARARGYLNDLAGAVTWALRAVNLAPESQPYRTALGLAEAAFNGSRLSEIQDEFESYIQRADDVPDAVAVAADNVARLIFDRSEGIPELQARAASVLARARGFLDDLCGAERWYARAANLAPDNSSYGRQRDLYREVIRDGTPC